MIGSRFVLLLPPILTAGLVACTPEPASPPREAVVQGMTEALLDTGFYSDVRITREIGMHWHPGEAAWTLLACFDFVAEAASPEAREGTHCIDSIRATQLTNGTWVIGVTIDEVYRWRAIGPVGAPATGT